MNDEAIVHTLCEWAVTTMRSGEHRAFVVAKLLERRQSEICGDADVGDDKGPILQNSVSAGNFPDKFSSSNCGQIFCQKTTDTNLSEY
jgi:mediator of RNA polymerase II transcription subunit 12